MWPCNTGHGSVPMAGRVRKRTELQGPPRLHERAGLFWGDAPKCLRSSLRLSFKTTKKGEMEGSPPPKKRRTSPNRVAHWPGTPPTRRLRSFASTWSPPHRISSGSKNLSASRPRRRGGESSPPHAALRPSGKQRRKNEKKGPGVIDPLQHQQGQTCVYIYIYIHAFVFVYIYMCIYREREREIQANRR